MIRKIAIELWQRCAIGEYTLITWTVALSGKGMLHQSLLTQQIGGWRKIRKILSVIVVTLLTLGLVPSRRMSESPLIMPEFMPVQIRIADLVQQSNHNEPTLKTDHRMMKITAYTKNDAGMNGKGITKNGEMVKEGLTIASDPSLPFGTQIYIPALKKTYTVTDRGGAIHGDRLDLYMENWDDAMEFGVWELEVWISKK